jgi:hypothetical protein
MCVAAAGVDRGQAIAAVVVVVVIVGAGALIASVAAFVVIDIVVIIVSMQIIAGNLIIQEDRFVPRIASVIVAVEVIRAGDAGQHQRQTRYANAQVSPHTNTLFQKTTQVRLVPE